MAPPPGGKKKAPVGAGAFSPLEPGKISLTERKYLISIRRRARKTIRRESTWCPVGRWPVLWVPYL